MGNSRARGGPFPGAPRSARSVAAGGRIFRRRCPLEREIVKWIYPWLLPPWRLIPEGEPQLVHQVVEGPTHGCSIIQVLRFLPMHIARGLISFISAKQLIIVLLFHGCTCLLGGLFVRKKGLVLSDSRDYPGVGLLVHRRLSHQDDDGVFVGHRTAHAGDPPEVFLKPFYPVRRVYH